MAKRSNLNLKAELEEKNEEFDHSDAFLGKDVLTMANKINSSRNIMFQSHIEQCVVLANPEFPKIFTNYENEVGKYSSGYKRSDNDYEVVKKISKYDNQPDYNYLLIVKDKNNNYDVIERTIGEKLTEDYCFMYQNEVIDSKTVGDTIEEGEVLYRSTSFDPDMNYRYGVNANTVYLIENNTIEDAICISDEFAKKLDSYYLSEIEINVNTNDILCNLYGGTNEDGEDEYKVLPDIGEETLPQILTARRRINYENALYDLQANKLKNINHNTDTIFYTNGIETDIDIYCNKELSELNNYFYNKQLVKYIEMQNKYNKEIVSVVEKILRDKHNKVSNDLKFIYRRAKDSLDPKIKWIEKTDFDNMIIIVRVMRKNPIHIGSKLVGRYGLNFKFALAN